MKSVLKRFQEVQAASSAYMEKNDCVVRSLSLVAEVDYEVAHRTCRLVGRRRFRGMYKLQSHDALKLLGCDAIDEAERLASIRRRKGSGITGKTVTKWMPKRGRWIVFFAGHAAPLVNGKLMDWTEDRNHRVVALWRVEKQA